MIETRTLLSDTKLEPTDLPSVLRHLARNGWKLAITESQNLLLSLAGVRPGMAVRATQGLRRPTSSMVGGDIFFQGKDVLYLVTSLLGPVTSPSFGRATYIVSTEGEPSLEIGIVSSDGDQIDGRLQAFSDSLEKAILASLDGRKTRYMSLSWKESKPGTPRIDDLIRSKTEGSGPKFERAKLVEEEIKAARLLSDQQRRETLIDISRAGTVRRRDLASRWKAAPALEESMNDLQHTGLVKSEFLVECKRSQAPLTRLRDKDQINNEDVGNLACPSCDARFADELLSEVFSLSELGQKMSRQSFWMTVWVTGLLTSLGISEDSILWSVSESGEEVDILVEPFGQLWVFELKDREFGSGDAHPLNYRRVMYGATKSIIVTTDKVSRDAKKVFEELGSQASRSGQPPGRPVYIEGLGDADGDLRNELSGVAFRSVLRRLQVLEDLSGYDLTAILAAKFGVPMDGPTARGVRMRF